MQEQKETEKEMQDASKEKNKKKAKMSKEKRFYLFTAIGCAAVLVAIIIVAVAVSNSDGASNQGGVNPNNSQVTQLPNEDDKDAGAEGDNEQPVVSTPDGMMLPIATATAGNDYGFYHNTTLNNYYVHTGVDFLANVGTQVVAVDDGVVESIYKDDVLHGTEITITHENGLKSVYRFVNEMENLSVGQEVERGQVIATVAEATGNEYKDGAHLHFEVLENGQSVDPTLYLTMDEK